LCVAVRDRHRHHGSAAFVGRDREAPAAHHFKHLPDVFQGDARLAVIDRLKICAVVLHGDFTAKICHARSDENVERFGILIHAMLYGVFHDGLQGQRRQAEIQIRRVIGTWAMTKLRKVLWDICARRRSVPARAASPPVSRNHRRGHWQRGPLCQGIQLARPRAREEGLSGISGSAGERIKGSLFSDFLYASR